MSSAGEFSFAIKAYDEASAVLKKATIALNEYKNSIKGINEDIRKYSNEQSSIYKGATKILESEIKKRIESHTKFSDSFEALKAKNKEFADGNKSTKITIEDIEKALSKTVRTTAAGVAGLTIAIRALKSFREDCVNVATQTQLVQNRLRYMASAINTTSTGVANNTVAVDEFISSLESMSPAVTESTYELIANGHNASWVVNNYKELNQMALMTGTTMESVANTLGSSNRQLLAQYGIQVTNIKEQMASIEASKIQVAYMKQYGVAMDQNAAMAEARKKVYADEIKEYTDQWGDFTNTYEGIMTEIKVAASVFKNSVGRVMATVISPIIKFGSTLMQFVANNRVLTWIVGIGAMIGTLGLAIASFSALFGAKVGVILKFLIGLKNGFASVFSLPSALKTMKTVLTMTEAETTALFEESTAARLAGASVTQESLAERQNAIYTTLDKNAKQRLVTTTQLATKSNSLYIATIIGKTKNTIAAWIADTKAYVVQKLGNKESQVGIVMRIREAISKRLSTTATVESTVATNAETVAKTANTRVSKLRQLANTLELKQMAMLVPKTIAYARALLFGEKAAKAAAIAKLKMNSVDASANSISAANGSFDLYTAKSNAANSAIQKKGGILSSLNIFGKGGAKGILSSIGNVFTFIGKGIGAVFTALGPVKAILMIIALLVPALIALIQNSGLMEIIQNIGKTLGEVFKPIADLVGEIFTLLGDLFKAILTPIINILSAILTPIINVIKTILEGGIAPVLMAIGKIVVSVLSVPLKLISTVLQFIFKLLSPVFSVVEMIADAVTPIFDAIMPIIDEALEPIMELLEPMFEILEPILSIFLEPLVDLLDMISPAIKEMGKFIKNFIVNPLETIMNIVDAIGDFFGGIGSFFTGGNNGNITVSSAVDTTAGARMISSASSMQAATGGMYTTTTNSGNTVTNNNGNSSITFNVTTNGNLDANSMRTIIKDEMHQNDLRNNAAFDSLNLG